MTPGGVLVVTFSGVLTWPTLEALKAPIADAMGGRAVAVVADYTAATLALSDADVSAMMAYGSPYNLPTLPAVVVADAFTAVKLGQAALDATISGGVLRSVAGSRAQGLQLLERLLAPGRAWP